MLQVSYRDFSLVWQRHRCYICGKHIRPSKHMNDLNGFTEDHVVPRSAGGNRRGGNMALACFRCNQRKQSRHPTACEVMFSVLMREAWIIDDQWRASVWVAHNVQGLCDRVFHGVSPWSRYKPTVSA